MSYFSELDIELQELRTAQALDDFASCAEPFCDCPACSVSSAGPEQMDHNYVNALGTLNEVRGIQAIATCTAFVAKMFGKSHAEVLDDAAEVLSGEDLRWSRIQAEFDRIHRAAGVDPASLPSGRRAQA